MQRFDTNLTGILRPDRPNFDDNKDSLKAHTKKGKEKPSFFCWCMQDTTMIGDKENAEKGESGETDPTFAALEQEFRKVHTVARAE